MAVQKNLFEYKSEIRRSWLCVSIQQKKSICDKGPHHEKGKKGLSRMTLVSKLLYAVSTLVLLHSGFSSYEFHHLLKLKSLNSAQTVIHELPKDIKYETYVGLVFFVLAVFTSFEKLQYLPIESNDGMIISEGNYLKEIALNKATNVDNLIGSNPNGEIVFTPSFVDVHAKRKLSREWASNNEKKEK